MPDPVFAHPRLAAIHDVFDGPRADLPAYQDIAAGRRRHPRRRVRDRMPRHRARGPRPRGGRVDPAEASLAVAKAKPGSERVMWLHGDATTLPALAVDLAVMTGNVAQVFLTDDDWSRALDGIRRALRAGAHFVFETRRPERRAREDWPKRPPTGAEVPGIGVMEQHHEVFIAESPRQ